MIVLYVDLREGRGGRAKWRGLQGIYTAKVLARHRSKHIQKGAKRIFLVKLMVVAVVFTIIRFPWLFPIFNIIICLCCCYGLRFVRYARFWLVNVEATTQIVIIKLVTTSSFFFFSPFHFQPKVVFFIHFQVEPHRAFLLFVFAGKQL
jgi:hypothetical protein